MKVTRRTGSLVIVLVIFAAIVLGTALAAIAIDKSEIPMLQQHAAEAAVTADGYTHGSNIGRATSGTAISTAGDLRNALNGSGTYYLTSNITLNASQSFVSNTTFSGTLYGNGHTVTVTGPLSSSSSLTSGIANGTAIGGLVGTLTGRIYDLNVAMANGTSAAYLSANGNIEMKVGLIAGILDGGTGSTHGAIIENCTVTIPSGSKLAGLSYTASGYANYNGANIGAIAGNANSSFTIRNVTVTNNGHILAGRGTSTSSSNSYSLDMGFSSMLVGLIWNDNANYQQDIDNIIAKGSGTVEGYVVSILGGTYVNSGSTIYPLSINNYYNQFTGTYSYGNSGGLSPIQFVSYTLFKWHSNDGSTLTNYYHSSGTNQSMMSSGYYAAPTNSITVSSNEYTVGFDPKATDTSNSLVVVKSGVTGGANYSATITGVNNNSYGDGYYAFNSAGDTVVFRNLPTAASNWSSGGNFTCTITTTPTEIQVPTYDELTKWEHGYVTSQTTSGTAINSGTQFENIFSPTGSLNQSGTYYLTDDIAITGFSGKEFSGTLDGNGHTIFITGTHTGMTGQYIGGLVGTLSGSGTIKNVRVVIWNSVTVGTSNSGNPSLGGIVGYLNGGTLENVQVVVPSGITFATQQFGTTPAFGGMVGEMNNAALTKVTAVIDGTLAPYGSYVWAAALVGKQAQGGTASTLTDVIVRGQGAFNVTSSNSGGQHEDAFLAAVTVFQEASNANRATVDGVIIDFTPTLNACDCYGIFTNNNINGGANADYSNIINASNIYVINQTANENTSGNKVIDESAVTKSIAETVQDRNDIPVTPYFPASSNGNLVLVAGDGTVTVPDLQYTNNAGTAFNSTADGNYKVVTVAKANVDTATVTLEEPVAVIVTVDPMNQWEHGYVASTTTSGTAIGSAEEFENYFSPSGNGSLSNGTYYLTGDITIRGFTGKTFGGTLDGNGHTIYIAAVNTGMTGKPIGGLVGELTGKIKNVRVVIGNNVTVGTTATGGSGSYPMIGGIVGYLNGGTLENVQVVVPSGITFATQQFSSTPAFGGMVGEMNGATLTKVTAVIDGTLAPYGSYVWAAALVGKQAQNGTASTLTDVIVRGQGTFNATASNTGSAHEDPFLAAVTVFQESSNVKRATVNGVIIDFTPTLNDCDCYGIFTNNNYGGGNGADYSNIVDASNIYVINRTSDQNTSGNKAIDESAVTSTIENAVQGLPDIPVTPYFPASANGNLVLVAGDGKNDVTTPLAYNNGTDSNSTDSFVSEAVTVGSAKYQVVTVEKANVKTKSVSLEIAEVNNPELTTTDFTYNGQNGIDVTVNVNTLQCGSYELKLGTDYTITIAAVAGGSVVENKPVNAGDYTLTVTLTKHIFADDSREKVLDFTVEKAKLTKPTANGNTFTYTGAEQTYTPDGFDSDTMTISDNVQTNADTYTVTVSVTDKYNYIWADNTDTDIKFTFVIGKADRSVTVTISGWTYGETESTPQIVGIQEGAVTTVTYSGTTNAGTEYSSATAPTAAGSYTVTVSWDETTNYTAGSAKSEAFTVAKASLTDGTTDFSTVYDGAAHGLNIVLSGFVNNETMETAGAVIQYSANGQDGWTADAITAENYTATPVRVYYKVLFNNYETVTGNHTVSISKKGIGISIKADDREYDGTTNVTLLGGELSGVVSGDNVTANLGTGTADQAGVGTDIPVTVNVTLTGDHAANYFISSYPTKLTVTISAKEIAVSWSNYELTYNGKAQLPVASANGVNGETVELTVAVKDGDSAVKAGDYTAVASTKNTNYSLTDDERKFSIAAKTVTFSAKTVDGAKLVYGTVPEDFNRLVTVTASGGIDLSAENWSFTVKPSVENGDYTADTNAGKTVILTVTITMNDPNHSAVQPTKQPTLVIQKAAISVTVKIDGWTYGGTPDAPEITGNSGNGGVTYSYTSDDGYDSDSQPVNAGDYKLTAKVAETDNYLSGVAECTFTIAKAPGSAKIFVNGTQYTEEVTSYYTGSEQIFKVTVEGHDGGAIDINGTPLPSGTDTMDYGLTDAGRTTTVKVTVAQTANYNEATATAEIEILPAVIQSVTLGTTEFTFGTLNTENANAAATYGDLTIGFAEGKGGGTPAFTYSLSYNNTVPGNDKKDYIVVGKYNLNLTLTGDNFVFDGNTSTTAVTVQVTKGKNTWISEDKIVDYPFGLEGKPVKGKAEFGTAAVTYYREGKAIEFNFKPMKQDAGTYTAVVSVAANGNNYDGISYEYTFVVQKHGLNITITELKISGTEESGTAGGFTVTYAPDMRLSATVKVGSAVEGYNGSVPELLGDPTTRTYLFEHSADAADPKAWTDGFPKNAGTYYVRVKGMELDAEHNINNFKFVSVPSVKLTIKEAVIEVTADIPENAVVYGMTAEEIRSRITLTNEEGVALGEVGVTLGDVKVTYNNGTDYNNTVAAGTELTISIVSVNAENKNYIAEFVGSELTVFVQQATLNVSAEGPSSVLSANFEPGKFDRYAAITATWDETPVTASEYFDVTLTGYEGDVAGMTPEEIFANKEIGTYTFTVSLKKTVQGNFVTDPESIVYELTLGQSIVTLTVSIGNWTYGGTAAKPKFTVKASDGTEIDILTIGQYITVNYSNSSGYNSPDQPTDAGTYTLTANIVGHHDYVAENAATATFTISPAEVKFGATLAKGAELVYGIFTDTAAAHDLVVVTAEGYPDLPFDYSVQLKVAGGTYSKTTPALTQVTVSVEVVTGPNYTAVQPGELALTVQKADQSVTVSIDGGGWTYGETAKEPDIDGIKENAATTAFYSGTTNAGKEYSSTKAPTAAGSYTVTVSWAETTNYTAGEAEPKAFTVEKAKLTKPTANGNTFTYTGAAQTYTPAGFDAATMTIDGNVQTNAGKYTVTVSVTDKDNYVWADNTDTDITFNFVIGKAEQSVDVSIDGWTYGDQAKDYKIVGIMENADTTAFYSGTTNAGVKYDSATAPTAAGSYTVTVSWDETTNYTAGKAKPVAFTVEKAKIEKPTANVDPFVYTGAEQTYTPEGFDAARMTIAGNVQMNADTYTVTVSVTDKYNYVWADNTDTDITFNFVIGKAEQSVDVSIDGWTYGDTAKDYEIVGRMENADYTVNYSGDGYSADTAPVNAGNYTLTITVDATANYNAAAASAEFTIAPKELHVSDSVMMIEAEYGELTLDNISSDEAILAVIGDYTAIFDGLVYDDVLTPDDFTLTAAEDYSDSVADGFMVVQDYLIKVALNATLTNYVVPESGLENITFRVVKADNSIGRYSVSAWTYLEVRSEYIPAFSAAAFGTVVGSFFDENGTEIAVDDFGATTPAGTYTFRLSVADSDNYTGATRTGSFVVGKRIVVAELTATDVTYDGAVYDGISYTLSFDVSDYIGTVGYEYSENGSAFRKGLPTDAGNYSVRIGEYSDSENIELRAETVDFQINPAPMHFTVTGVDGASVEYGTAIDDIDVNALIVSVIPDSYVGGFEFTVSLITANGTAYRPGLYAGTVLYATVNITLNSNNYYPVVDTAIEMLPKVNITKVSHDMAFEVSDEIIADGSSAVVIEGSANTVIDAISYYMAINDIQYYEYHITVDGEEYSRNFNWAPGTHTVEVRLSGNHEGSTQFTVVIEEDPDVVDRAPFIPKTVVGEVLESINFTWASAVSIAFGVAVAVLIILFFGLRRAKRK